MKWIPITDKLPDRESKESVWSKQVVVWAVDENEEGRFVESCMFNFHLNKWNGLNGISGNYDDSLTATHWLYSDDFIRKITPK